MKTNKIFSAVLVALVAAGMGLSSCNDQLDLAPIDYYGAGNFWKTEAQAVGNMSAMMQHFRGTYEFQSVITYGELRGGAYTLEVTGSDGAGLNSQGIREQNFSEDLPQVSNFGSYWGLIANINMFIYQVEQAKYFTSEETREYCLGMAYGLRAYWHFHLYKAYGGIPLRTTPDVALGNYNPLTLYKARSEASEVMALIKEDIDTSLKYFGNQTSFNFNDASKNAKYYWSKAATEMLAGEVYLWNSKVTTGNQPATKADLATAKTHFENVINNYGLTLQNGFANVFSTSNRQNAEVIFAFQHSYTESTNAIPSAYGYGIVTGYTIGAGYDADGNLWNNPHTIGSTVNRYQYSNALWYQFDAADERRDVTFSASYHDAEAKHLRGTFVRKNLGGISSETTYRMYDADQPLYRLALAYLSLAEIANMQDDVNGVETNINIIRQRAYGANYDAAVHGYKAGSFVENEVAILHEKDKEFVQEGQRWYDVRRMTVSKDCGETDHLLFHNEGHIAYGLNIDNETMRELSPTSWAAAPLLEVKPILETEYAYRALWPIDVTVMNSDPLLTQTPGYPGNEKYKSPRDFN